MSLNRLSLCNQLYNNIGILTKDIVLNANTVIWTNKYNTGINYDFITGCRSPLFTNLQTKLTTFI